MSKQASFLAELRESIHAGAALAVLTCAVGCSGDATPSSVATESYSLDQLGCFGPKHDDGYYGQCCFEAHCYTPSKGEACAGAGETSALHDHLKFGLPSGSGSCGCSVPEEGLPSISGPFAPNPADDTASAGSCCYVVGAISCAGRPLVVDGTQLVAAAVQRNDWLVAV